MSGRKGIHLCRVLARIATLLVAMVTTSLLPAFGQQEVDSTWYDPRAQCQKAIVHLWLANCYFSQDSSGFPVLLRFCDARSGRSFHPLHRHPGPLARTWRRPFHSCGVAASLGSAPMRPGRWYRTLSDVQPRHSRPTLDAEVPELRQRSALSLPPVASQSADSGGDRNQVPPLRSPVSSVRGKVNRHPSTRVFRSHVVLDDCRSRKQTARFQDLLQPPSHAYLTGRANAGSARVTTSSQSALVAMATPLSGPLSDTGGCLISQRLALSAIFGQPRQNFQAIIRSFSIAACFAAPIVSLPPVPSQK